MKLYGVVGWKNCGKTTLVERLVTDITGRGVNVSTIKHAHHHFDIDHDGKDSWRHRQAGASQVLVSSGARWALIRELRGAPEPTLEDLLTLLEPVDLVLIEGYKRDPHHKIETHRADAHRVGAGRMKAPRDLIAREDPTVRALATDSRVADAALPQFDLNDVRGVADFILSETGLRS